MLWFKGKAKDIQQEKESWKEFKLLIESALIKCNTNAHKIDELQSKQRGMDIKFSKFIKMIEEESEEEENENNIKTDSLSNRYGNPFI